ncbi:MAG: hypothetical protein GEU68_11665 [Actinobacteria bacterium]|nr:hypothetical protein [Actinomycetota bacterium]
MGHRGQPYPLVCSSQEIADRATQRCEPACFLSLTRSSRRSLLCRLQSASEPDTQTSGTGLAAGETAAIKGGAVANGVKAYILIQTVTNAAHVAREIRDLDGVLTADDVSGPYDVIVQIAAENMDELGKSVVNRIQAVEGISRTLTCPVVQF